jgi:PAS domain S-box-containing protein
MSSSLDTNSAMLTELVDLRRQVLELQQALARTEQRRTMFGDDGPVSGMVHTIEDITARRHIDEQVRDSEARWRALYEHAGVGIAQLSLDGQFLRVNPCLCEMLQYSPETMLQRKFHDFTHPDELSINLDGLNGLLAGKQPSFSIEKRYRRSDGTWVWGDVTVSLVRTASGHPASFIAVIQHIDARKQAEYQLRDSEQAIRSLLEAMSNPGLTLGERIQTVLELGCRRFWLPIGLVTEARGDQLEIRHVWAPSTTFDTGMHVPLDETYCGETMKSKDVVSCEHVRTSRWSNHPGYKKLGLECYIGAPLTDQNRPYGTICFMGSEPYPRRFSQADKDFLQLMTRWVSGELLRNDSEHALRLTQTAVDRSADLVFWIDQSARFLYVNDAACRFLGYSREELLCMAVADIDPEYQRDKWPAHWEELRQTSQLRFESRHRTKSGETYPVEIVANFVAIDGHEYYFAFARDISDRRRSYSLLQAAINSVADGLLVIDRQGNVTSANERFLRLWNVPQTLMDNRDNQALLAFVADQLREPDDFLHNVRELYLHPEQESFDVLELKDERVFERYSRPQTLDGEIVGRVWSFRDITAHMRAEKALRASELRLQHFVEEAPVGLCILDEHWRSISANRAFCELTGYEPHELIGSTYALYTHPEDLSATIVLMDEFFRGARSGHAYETRYIRKTGEVIWVSVKATRIALSGYPRPLLLSAIQDITEQKLAMEEREHLSRDLHDNMLQTLYAIGMQLEAGKLAMEKSPRRSKAHMTQAIGQLNNLMLDVRRFIALLTQRTTAQLNFGQALRQLITSMSGAGQATPELEIKNPALAFITPLQGEQLLNIVREALSNSMRHAHASHRWVRLSVVDNKIRLVIGDNGIGFPPKQKRRSGHGLGNMAARAKQILALFTLDSASGKGTSIRVDVPLKKGTVHE